MTAPFLTVVFPSDNSTEENPATQIFAAREKINAEASSRRLLAHAIFTPGQPGWLEDLDEVIEYRPGDIGRAARDCFLFGAVSRTIII